MAQKGGSKAGKQPWPDRKAHANLAEVEGHLLAGLSKSSPELVEADGTCPQCVALEHALADEYQAQGIASELTDH